MKKVIEIINDNLKEFDKKPGSFNSISEADQWLESKENKLYFDFAYPENECELDPEKVKQYFLQSQIIVIDELIKYMSGEMFENSAQAGQFAMHSDGYNQALEDQAYSLEEVKKELVEELESLISSNNK